MCYKPVRLTSQHKSSSLNMIKFSMTKVVILTCISILSNEILPDGWKATDFCLDKNSKNKNKNTKYKNQKNYYNYENQNYFYTKPGKIGTLDDLCLSNKKCTSGVNVEILNSLNSKLSSLPPLPTDPPPPNKKPLGEGAKTRK